MTQFYAAEGMIGQDRSVEGGIAITAEQYEQALAGMLDGKQVSIVEGTLSIAFPAPPEPEPEIPPEPPTNYRLYKSVLIRRMSEQEATGLEGVLAAADARLRLLFNSVEYFVSDDELFSTLYAAVGQALGEQRAAELLSAE